MVLVAPVVEWTQCLASDEVVQVRLLPGALTNMENKRLSAIIILISLFLFSADQVLAICEGPIVPCGMSGQPICQFCHIFALINNILNFLLTCLTPVIAGLMLVFGGLYLLTAGTSPERFSQAKSIITAVIIGLVIVFLSWIFLNTFLDAIGVAEWTGLGTWWKISCP